MVTFLVQKEMIHYGLKDKGFLYKKNNKQMTAREEAERRCLVPEEQKKSKDLKQHLKAVQESLRVDRFEDACRIFLKILGYTKPTWHEVSFLWTYAVSKRSTRCVRIVLDLISYGKVITESNEEKSIMSNSIDLMKKTQGALINQYGNYLIFWSKFPKSDFINFFRG